MIKQRFSLKQLVSLNVHLGGLSKTVHHNVGHYIIGRYSGIVLLNLNLSLLYLRRSLMMIDKIILADGKFLLVSPELSLQNLLKTKLSTIQMYSYSVGWVGGFLTNFKEIRNYLLNKQKGHYLKNKRNLSKFVKYSNIAFLSRMPLVVFSLGLRYNNWIQRETYSLNIPLISLVDSDINPIGITYSIPGNDDSINFLYYLILMISSVAFVAHCSKSINFRVKALIKAQQLLANS